MRFSTGPYLIVILFWWQVQQLESVMLPCVLSRIRVEQLLYLLLLSAPASSCPSMPSVLNPHRVVNFRLLVQGLLALEGHDWVVGASVANNGAMARCNSRQHAWTYPDAADSSSAMRSSCIQKAPEVGTSKGSRSLRWGLLSWTTSSAGTSVASSSTSLSYPAVFDEGCSIGTFDIGSPMGDACATNYVWISIPGSSYEDCEPT